MGEGAWSNEERAALRKQVIAERKAMDSYARLFKSDSICERLLQSLDLTLTLSGVQPAEFIVGVYSAFPEEVQLDAFIRGAYERGVRVAFPVMVRDAHGLAGCCQQTMELREVSTEAYVRAREILVQHGGSLTFGEEPDPALDTTGCSFLVRPLKRYGHDDAELADNPYVFADELGMLVCPCVAFDEDGNRLGYGGGNYDRYLTQIHPGCRVVGVAFAEQQVPQIPAEEHDIPIPFVAL